METFHPKKLFCKSSKQPKITSPAPAIPKAVENPHKATSRLCVFLAEGILAYLNSVSWLGIHWNYRLPTRGEDYELVLLY